jgi:putative SOS response-associated peptidase YedK
MALAGLWENWRSPAGRSVRIFAVITTTPNELCAALHDRMPVILARLLMWTAPDGIKRARMRSL